MLTFEYTAKDTKTGKEVKSIVQADSEQSAAKMLNKEGLTPIELKVKGESRSFLGGFKNRIGTKDKVLFTRQLSTLINAGLPLTQSLRTVAEQTNNKKLTIIVNDIISSVEAGKTLAESMSKHPEVFNTVYVNLVAAGETSGTLDEALERIASQQEKDAEIASKVRGAMVYPAIVLVVISLVIIFMLTTVLPQVELLYQDLDQTLPLVTAILLGISKFLIKFWYVLVFVIGASIYFLNRYSKTPSGKAVFDKLKMSFPLFGKLFMKMYMARFCRTGQTLLATGVPMLETLNITGRAVNNVHIEASVQKAAVKVKGGKALSASLEGDENFLTLVPQMIRIGEQSGSIDAMLGKAADFYEKELDNEIKTISSTIEPVLMVVLAGVAGLLVLAILLPVYGLVGQSLSL